jgi:hypothetical protein
MPCVNSAHARMSTIGSNFARARRNSSSAIRCPAVFILGVSAKLLSKHTTKDNDVSINGQMHDPVRLHVAQTGDHMVGPGQVVLRARGAATRM